MLPDIQGGVMKVNCKHCGRYLMTAEGNCLLSGVICPNSKCKAKMNIKIVFSLEDDAMHKLILAAESAPKSLAIMRDKE